MRFYRLFMIWEIVITEVNRLVNWQLMAIDIDNHWIAQNNISRQQNLCLYMSYRLEILGNFSISVLKY